MSKIEQLDGKALILSFFFFLLLSLVGYAGAQRKKVTSSSGIPGWANKAVFFLFAQKHKLVNVPLVVPKCVNLNFPSYISLKGRALRWCLKIALS